MAEVFESYSESARDSSYYSSSVLSSGSASSLESSDAASTDSSDSCDSTEVSNLYGRSYWAANSQSRKTSRPFRSRGLDEGIVSRCVSRYGRASTETFSTNISASADQIATKKWKKSFDHWTVSKRSRYETSSTWFTRSSNSYCKSTTSLSSKLASSSFMGYSKASASRPSSSTSEQFPFKHRNFNTTRICQQGQHEMQQSGTVQGTHICTVSPSSRSSHSQKPVALETSNLKESPDQHESPSRPLSARFSTVSPSTSYHTPSTQLSNQEKSNSVNTPRKLRNDSPSSVPGSSNYQSISNLSQAAAST